MIRVYIRRKNEIAGHVFKSKSSVLRDRVALLHWGFVIKGLITEDEWNKSVEVIKDKFDLIIKETQIDGRSKLARSLESFSWAILMQKNNGTFNTMGYCGINNHGGMEIEISRDNSMVRYRTFGRNISDWKEIHFTDDGERYFLVGGKRGHRYYLRDFMKI